MNGSTVKIAILAVPQTGMAEDGENVSIIIINKPFLFLFTGSLLDG